MALAFVAVGSNIEPEENVARGLVRLAQRVGIQRVSTFYRTRPVDGRDAPSFINGVVEVRTTMDPAILKTTVLRSIEQELGRQRTDDPYADRTLDLDLVLYDDISLQARDLTLPDPEIARRAFIALPLLELAPDLTLPGSGIPLSSLVETLDASEMQPLGDFTAQLRRSVQHG
jgi:2-amino-4-hydroxy-6-hydroxymethyldihydropteridine diphosphokinase